MKRAAAKRTARSFLSQLFSCAISQERLEANPVT